MSRANGDGDSTLNSNIVCGVGGVLVFMLVLTHFPLLYTLGGFTSMVDVKIKM